MGLRMYSVAPAFMTLRMVSDELSEEVTNIDVRGNLSRMECTFPTASSIPSVSSIMTTLGLFLCTISMPLSKLEATPSMEAWSPRCCMKDTIVLTESVSLSIITIAMLGFILYYNILLKFLKYEHHFPGEEVRNRVAVHALDVLYTDRKGDVRVKLLRKVRRLKALVGATVVRVAGALSLRTVSFRRYLGNRYQRPLPDCMGFILYSRGTLVEYGGYDLPLGDAIGRLVAAYFSRPSRAYLVVSVVPGVYKGAPEHPAGFCINSIGGRDLSKAFAPDLPFAYKVTQGGTARALLIFIESCPCNRPGRVFVFSSGP